MHSLLNPLLRHPVIRTQVGYLAPVPQLLLDRCGEGIYRDFQQHLECNEFQQFSRDMGRVFQAYIEYLVRNSNSWSVWSEQPYHGMRTCDLFILDGQDLALTECKVTRLRDITKTWMSQANYEHELREITEGVEAIVRTAKHLKEGKLSLDGLDIAHIQKWAGIVVTMDNYLLRPSTARIISSTDGKQLGMLPTRLARDHFIRLCRKQIKKSKHISLQDVERFPEGNIQVVSADDFEQHLATTMSGHTRLFDLTTGRVLQSVHPVLGERFKRYWRSIPRPTEGN